LTRPLAVTTVRTVIAFLVSVPVLSEAITLADPAMNCCTRLYPGKRSVLRKFLSMSDLTDWVMRLEVALFRLFYWLAWQHQQVIEC